MSIRLYLKELISNYRHWSERLYAETLNYPWQHEEDTCARMLDLLQRPEDPFSRNNFYGHITGSAFIFHPSDNKILLTLHKKLGKWLQLGGHSDEAHPPHLTALREGLEESGLTRFSFYPLGTTKQNWPIPFDLDIHQIPERRKEPAHLHFDFRYLLVCDQATASIKISDESSDLAWMSIEEAKLVTQETSMLRQFDKFLSIQSWPTDIPTKTSQEHPHE